MRRLIMLLVLVALVGGVPMMGMEDASAARWPESHCLMRFDNMDANGDGVLSWPEYQSANDFGTYKGIGPSPATSIEQMFMTKDVGGQGYLTREEFCGTR